MLYHLTVKSNNTKTGAIPVTTSGKETCPPNCPLRKSGCYANSGALQFHWGKVNRGERGDNFPTFIAKLESLPTNSFVRLNQAGDLPGKGNRINGKKLDALIKANKGKRFFTYTHKLVLGNSYVAKQNRKHIARANKNGLTINLSGNNTKNADSLKKLNIAPVVTILPLGSANASFTPKNNKVIVCPAQQIKGMTCEKCKLCQKQRGVIVGFIAHSTAKNIVSNIAMGITS